MTYWVTEVNDNEYATNRASGIIANQMAAEAIGEIGFRILHYPRMHSKELQELNVEKRREKLEALLNTVLPGDLVIVQYPLWTNYMQFELEFVRYLKNDRKAKVVALVWDIISWIHDDRKRDYTKDASLWILNEYDLVVAANPKMANRLLTEGGVKTPMISMDLTDFIYHGPLKEKRFIKQLFYVATGIDPAIINEYQSSMPINFIGPYNKKTSTFDYIHLLGPMRSEEIPFQFDGGFGLLYYPTGGGYKGMSHYGEYNNPMKLSLYLAAGLPVIMLSNMAHAEWVKKYRLGIVVDSLSQIDAAIDNLVEADYDEMLTNLKPWQHAVTNGFFSKQLALEAIRFLELGFVDRLLGVGEDQ
jgi:hypothetical protein